MSSSDAAPPPYSAFSANGGGGGSAAPPSARSSKGSAAGLVEMGATASFASWVIEEELSTAHRIYVIDNSGSTSIDDGKIQLRASSGGLVPRGATRWEEIKQLSIQQAQYNVAVGVPAEFHLLNPKDASETREGRDFVVVEDSSGVDALQRMLSGTRPGGGTPLAERLELIQNRLARRHPWNGNIFLVIVTDGVPTPTEWSGNSKFDREDPKRRMVQQLRQITSKFPVTLVVRLCTDNDSDVAFWGDLDDEEEFSLDVLDDMWSEAEEIKKAGNGWLTYTPLLHTFRTAGTKARSFDLLDERQLAKQQAAFIAEKLLLGGGADGSAEVPFYGDAEFMAQVRERLANTAEVSCPLSRRTRPVLDARGLEAAVTGKASAAFETLPGSNMQWLVFFAVLYFVWPMISNAVLGSGSGNEPSHYNGRR